MIVRCQVCGADPDGGWRSPPAMIFHDRYLEDGSIRRRERPKRFRVRLPDHLSEKREKEIQDAGEGPLEEGRAAMNGADGWAWCIAGEKGGHPEGFHD